MLIIRRGWGKAAGRARPKSLASERPCVICLIVQCCGDLPWAPKDLSHAADPEERRSTRSFEQENACPCLQGRWTLVTRSEGLDLASARYGPPPLPATAKVFDAL